jgi:hypothetical protein
VTLALFDGDAVLDLIVAERGANTVGIAFGNGVGGFSSLTHLPVGTAPTALGAADLSGDGFVDIVTANLGSNDLSILYGDGAGGTLATLTFPVGAAPVDLSIADAMATPSWICWCRTRLAARWPS